MAGPGTRITGEWCVDMFIRYVDMVDWIYGYGDMICGCGGYVDMVI